MAQLTSHAATTSPLSKQPTPQLGIVCGSGLSHLADEIKGDDRMEVAYDKIPGYPKATGGAQALHLSTPPIDHHPFIISYSQRPLWHTGVWHAEWQEGDVCQGPLPLLRGL